MAGSHARPGLAIQQQSDSHRKNTTCGKALRVRKGVDAAADLGFDTSAHPHSECTLALPLSLQSWGT